MRVDTSPLPIHALINKVVVVVVVVVNLEIARNKNSSKKWIGQDLFSEKTPRGSILISDQLPYAVFSLNFSSAGKEPFMDGKAKNIYFSKRGCTVPQMIPSRK